MSIMCRTGAACETAPGCGSLSGRAGACFFSRAVDWVKYGGRRSLGRMLETNDVLLLARLQFAFTISAHILFPAISIGLANYLAVLEGLWLRTGKIVYRELS